MDPTETLANILGSLRHLSKTRQPGSPGRRNAVDSLRDLASWLDASGSPAVGGGFPPDVDAAIETYHDRFGRGEIAGGRHD